MAFIFGGNTPWTYETLKKKREIADALLMANSSTPKNVGEGLNAIGRALTVRGINRKADKRDAELKGEFDAQFNAAFGGYGSGGGMGGGGVSSGAGYAPTGASASPRPVDPNSPTALGDETMAALGKAPLIANSDRLAGVDPRIEEVLSLAASNLGLELGVSEGLRDIETQKKYVAEGKSQTMNSKHLHGNAADFHLIGPDGQPNWDFEAYRPLAEEAKRIAAEKGYTGFEWGGDWKTLKDGVHFQFDGHDHSGDATVPATPGAAPSGGSPAPQGGGMPQGMDLGTLASLAANPYATPGQKAVINALMEQQMKAMDPMYQLQLQQQQLELAQMQNPETKLNDYDMRAAEALQYGLQAGTPEYQAFVLTGKMPEADSAASVPAGFASLDMQAQAAGYEPGTPEYQEFMANGGGSGTPAAFTALDMQAQAAGLKPGTPEYQEFMATRGAGFAAAATEKGKAQAAAEIAAPADIVTADRTLQYIDEVRNHPGRQQGTGVSSWGNWVPGTSGKDFQNRVDQLKSGAFLTAIDEMRGMGALSNAEGQTATAAITRMDTATSEDEFLAALNDYESIVKIGRDRAAGRVKTPDKAAADAPITVTTDAEYDALPSGTVFVDPEGKTRRKP